MGPDLPEAVEAVRRRHDPAAAAGIPPHVTLMFPFLPLEGLKGGAMQQVAAALEGVSPFPFSLTRVCDLPGDVTVLEAEPRGRFLELTRRVARRWPELRPYGGAIEIEGIIPHLTLGHELPAATRARVESLLAPRLPLEAEADAVSLLAERDGWSVETVFSLR